MQLEAKEKTVEIPKPVPNYEGCMQPHALVHQRFMVGFRV